MLSAISMATASRRRSNCLLGGVNGGGILERPAERVSLIDVTRALPLAALLVLVVPGRKLVWGGIVLALTSPARLQAIALAVHLEDVDVVGEPIEERAGEPLRAEDAIVYRRGGSIVYQCEDPRGRRAA